MSRNVERAFGAVLLLSILGPAQSQTIADYSRAQRALIDTSIQRSARPALEPAVVPLPALPATPAAVPTAPPARPPSPTATPTGAAPELVISGVVVTPTRRSAEVVVDGVPFLLDEGQRVPETRWSVSHIGTDRVVLAREPQARRGRVQTRTFVLAAAER